MDQVTSFVLERMAERGAVPPEADWEHYDFVRSGVIDSFEILSFLMEIEAHFAIRIAPQDLLGEGLKTVGGLCALIHSKLAGITR